MKTVQKPSPMRLVAGEVRQRIERGGERVWRMEDFRDLPSGAVAQALSRLTRRQVVQRVGKGLYYQPRATTFGPSRPNPTSLGNLLAHERAVFPSGLTAASALGLTTQSPARYEVATSASNLPRRLVGEGTVVHTRRPAAWSTLSQADGALLDVLRQRGSTSELVPEETCQRVLELLRGRFERLLAVAATEPPRVRAMLGALGEVLGQDAATLAPLRRSLNPLSKFDFGVFAHLSTARSWQAKRSR